MRWVLFPKNAFSAFTLIYRPWKNGEKPPIIHFAPLPIDQIADLRKRPWAITINEQEIQMIDPKDAETGKTLVWKLALWGTFQDKNAIERLEALFSSTLDELYHANNRHFSQGVELRDKRKTSEQIRKDIDDLSG